MPLGRRRTVAWLVLGLWALAGLLWLLRFDFAGRISTDVLDLVPTGERDAEIAVVREMAGKAEARTVLLLLESPGGGVAPIEAAREFAQNLTHSPLFAQAVAIGDPAWRDAIGRELFELRLPLLFPGWLRERESPTLAADVARRLKTFLETPEALAYQDLVPADPLLLLPDALARLRHGLALLQAGDTASSGGLVWAQLAVSPLSEEGQAPAFAAIEAAAARVRASHPGLTVAYTGVNRFAATSRTRIQREMTALNLGSTVAVLLVALVFIRSAHRALHLVPAIAFAVLAAWMTTTLTFGRVHVIVFVLGALLTGVAIDYGFYLFMQPPVGPDEPYWSKARRLAKPLVASCLTTVTGFGLLLFSELPMIRQLGVFVGAGLVAAMIAALLYFSTLRDPFLSARQLPSLSRGSGAKGRRVLVLVFWAALLPGLFRLTWRDDVRDLEVPAAELRAEDARIRRAFGHASGATIYLTRGATLDEARVALQRFERWLNGRAQTANLGAVVPTPDAREGAAAFLREQRDFAATFRRALEAEGFDAEQFGPFFTAFAAYTEAGPENTRGALDRLRQSLAGPIALLLHQGENQSWFVTLARDAPAEPPPADTQTVTASQLQALNHVFARYRMSALQLSLVGLALVGLGVFLSYGVRDGIRIFAIPCGACAAVFGLFGWLGLPLNLFHLLGAFLGVCLTHNYSIFSATSAYRNEAPPVSVRLSALTTAASFGALGLSGIPVVRSLGLTVSAIVVFALLAIELEHLSPLGRTQPPK